MNSSPFSLILRNATDSMYKLFLAIILGKVSMMSDNKANIKYSTKDYFS